MYKKITATFLLTIFYSLFVGVQAAVNIKADISPSIIRIGEQAIIDITIKSSHPDEIRLLSAKEMNASGGDIEFLKLDTLPSQDLADGRKESHFQYTITSFEDSLYYIDPIAIRCAGKIYRTNELSLKVESIPVDTTLLIGFGPKDVFKAYATWDEYGWCGAWGVSLLITVLSVFFLWACLYLFRQKSVQQPTVSKKVQLPVHEKVLMRFHELLNQASRLDAKPFYTELTDALRYYMQKRYYFKAREMTSGEILAHLKTVNDTDQLTTIRRIFQISDLIKFAKQSDVQAERTDFIRMAQQYVEQTKLDNPDAYEPEAIPQEDKKTAGLKFKKRQRYFRTGLFLLGATVLLLMFYVVSNLYVIIIE